MEPPPASSTTTSSTFSHTPPQDENSEDEDSICDDEDQALRFKGEIIVVKELSEVETALAKLLEGGEAHKQGIGFDMEWQPEFNQGEINPISVIQLATDSVAVLFLMRHLGGMPLPLRQVLAGSSLLKIGQALDTRDCDKLLHEFDLTLVRTVDVSQVARNMGIRKTGLKNLVSTVFGVKLNKKLATSDWGRWNLTPQQVTYAATDAFVTRKLYYALLSPPPESMLFQRAIMWQQQQQLQQQIEYEEHQKEQAFLHHQHRMQQQQMRHHLKQQRKQQRQAQRQKMHEIRQQRKQQQQEQTMLPLDIHAYPPLPSKPHNIPDDLTQPPRRSQKSSSAKPRSATDPQPPLRHYLQMLQKPAPPEQPSPQPSPPPSPPVAQQSSPPVPIASSPPSSPQQPQRAPQARPPRQSHQSHQSGGQTKYINIPPPTQVASTSYPPSSSPPMSQKNRCLVCSRWFRNGHALRQHNRAVHMLSTHNIPMSPPPAATSTTSIPITIPTQPTPPKVTATTTIMTTTTTTTLTMTTTEACFVSQDNTINNTSNSNNSPDPVASPNTNGRSERPVDTKGTTVVESGSGSPNMSSRPRSASAISTIRCPVCGVTFSSLKACKQHQQDKKHFAYSCQHCNVPFASRSACEQHQMAKNHVTTATSFQPVEREIVPPNPREGHPLKGGMANDRGPCSCAGCRMRIPPSAPFNMGLQQHPSPQQHHHNRSSHEGSLSSSGEKEEEGRRQRRGGSGIQHAEQQQRRKEEEAPNPIIMNLLRELQRMPPPQPHPAAWFAPVFPPPPRVMDARFRNY